MSETSNIMAVWAIGHSFYLPTSAGARAFKLGGPNLKVEGAKIFFIDFSLGKACRA